MPGKRVQPVWESSGWFIRTKSERGAKLLWLGHTSTKNKQLCQLNAESVATHDDAVSIMVEVGESMVNGAEDAYDERRRVLDKYGVTISKGKRKFANTESSCAGVGDAALVTPDTLIDSSTSETPAPKTPPRKVAISTMHELDRYMPMSVDMPAGMTEAFME